MQSAYYDTGYLYALEQLGMMEKGAAAAQVATKAPFLRRVGQGIKGLFSRGSKVEQGAAKAAPRGKAPEVSAGKTPDVKPTKSKDERTFLQKAKWPLIGIGGLGAAGLGGYAYLRSRDPMGGTGQLPSGYSGVPGYGQSYGGGSSYR